MAEKRMPIYGINFGNFREFFAHKLAKYQYFSMQNADETKFVR